MGFGILLIGYMLSMSLYPGYTDCIAYMIVFYALVKLGEFNGYFKAAKLFAFVLTVMGTCGLMLMAGEFIGIVDESSKLIALYDNASEAVKIAFHVVLLLGISAISRQTDLPKYSATAVWCIVIDAVYTAIFVSSFFVQRLLPFSMLMRLVLTIAVGVLIFNCYRMICLEGDEDMPLYNSRFEVVNKLRRRLEEKAEIGNRKGEETAEHKRRQAEAKKNGVDISKKFTESRKKK